MRALPANSELSDTSLPELCTVAPTTPRKAGVFAICRADRRFVGAAGLLAAYWWRQCKEGLRWKSLSYARHLLVDCRASDCRAVRASCSPLRRDELPWVDGMAIGIDDQF